MTQIPTTGHFFQQQNAIYKLKSMTPLLFPSIQCLHSFNLFTLLVLRSIGSHYNSAKHTVVLLPILASKQGKLSFEEPWAMKHFQIYVHNAQGAKECTASAAVACEFCCAFCHAFLPCVFCRISPM